MSTQSGSSRRSVKIAIVVAVAATLVLCVFTLATNDARNRSRSIASQTQLLESLGFTAVEISQPGRADVMVGNCETRVFLSERGWAHRPKNVNYDIVITSAADLAANPYTKLDHCS